MPPKRGLREAEEEVVRLSKKVKTQGETIAALHGVVSKLQSRRGALLTAMVAVKSSIGFALAYASQCGNTTLHSIIQTCNEGVTWALSKEGSSSSPAHASAEPAPVHAPVVVAEPAPAPPQPAVVASASALALANSPMGTTLALATSSPPSLPIQPTGTVVFFSNPVQPQLETQQILPSPGLDMLAEIALQNAPTRPSTVAVPRPLNAPPAATSHAPAAALMDWRRPSTALTSLAAPLRPSAAPAMGLLNWHPRARAAPLPTPPAAAAAAAVTHLRPSAAPTLGLLDWHPRAGAAHLPLPPSTLATIPPLPPSAAHARRLLDWRPFAKTAPPPPVADAPPQPQPPVVVLGEGGYISDSEDSDTTPFEEEGEGASSLRSDNKAPRWVVMAGVKSKEQFFHPKRLTAAAAGQKKQCMRRDRLSITQPAARLIIGESNLWALVNRNDLDFNMHYKGKVYEGSLLLRSAGHKDGIHIELVFDRHKDLVKAMVSVPNILTRNLVFTSAPMKGHFHLTFLPKVK